MVKFSEGSEHYRTVVFLLHRLCDIVATSSASSTDERLASKAPRPATTSDSDFFEAPALLTTSKPGPQEQRDPKSGMGC